MALMLLLMQYNALAQTTSFSIVENGTRNEVVGRVFASGSNVEDFRWVHVYMVIVCQLTACYVQAHACIDCLLAIAGWLLQASHNL